MKTGSATRLSMLRWLLAVSGLLYAGAAVYVPLMTLLVGRRTNYWADQPWRPHAFRLAAGITIALALLSAIALAVSAVDFVLARKGSRPMVIGVTTTSIYFVWLRWFVRDQHEIVSLSLFNGGIYLQWYTGFILWCPALLLAYRFYARLASSNNDSK